MTELRDLFRKNLKALRKSKGYSQRDLSEECNYTRSYVGQLERGEKDPSFESLIRLADSLELSILDFFRNDSDALDVELTEAIKEMTNLSDNNIRSITTVPELMNWETRMIGLLDPRGRILDFNRSGFEFVHESKDEIFGNKLWELKIFDESDDHVEWVKQSLDLIHEQSLVRRTTFIFTSPTEGETEVEVTLLPMNVANGKKDYIVVEGLRGRQISVTDSPSERPTTEPEE